MTEPEVRKLIAAAPTGNEAIAVTVVAIMKSVKADLSTRITDVRDEARRRLVTQEFQIANLQAQRASDRARIADLEAELKGLRQPV